MTRRNFLATLSLALRVVIHVQELVNINVYF